MSVLDLSIFEWYNRRLEIPETVSTASIGRSNFHYHY